MKVVLIEDERLAAEHLQDLLLKTEPEIQVMAVIDSVSSAVLWFQNNPTPDLVFMDIQLGDGLSFSIFEQCVISCPVIFTTAYNEYAIEAFKVNSIAYLLKPLKQKDLQAAILKFKSSPWYSSKEKSGEQFIIDKLLKVFTHTYKRRFLIKTGVHIKSIPVEEIMYFYSMEKATFLTTITGKNYNLDYTLEELEELVDTSLFFRINRQYLIAVSSLEDIITDAKYRLRLKLKFSTDPEILVSRDKMSDFKTWLDK